MSQQRKLAELANLPCACASLRRAARAVTQLYGQEMRKAGLRVTQMTLLQALSEMGRTVQGRLGEILLLDSTTLTRTLKPLREKGWVRSVPGSDRRERLYELTPSGSRVLKKTRKHWERAQERLRMEMGEAAWEGLLEVTHRAAQSAQVAQRQRG